MINGCFFNDIYEHNNESIIPYKSNSMKKVILFFVSVLFIMNGFSQNNNNNSASSYIKVQMADSARTFSINYPNGDEFRKKLMLAWGQPNVITAGTIEWSPLTLQNIGNNLTITLSDGVETIENSVPVFKTFMDDVSKYSMINDLQSNQKRKITLVFRNAQGINAVASKSFEQAAISEINRIITSVW